MAELKYIKENCEKVLKSDDVLMISVKLIEKKVVAIKKDEEIELVKLPALPMHTIELVKHLFGIVYADDFQNAGTYAINKNLVKGFYHKKLNDNYSTIYADFGLLGQEELYHIQLDLADKEIKYLNEQFNLFQAEKEPENV